jgi:hypothetical protein
MFSAVNFSNAMLRMAGLQGAMDGKLVRAILTGRSDIEVLSDGHYKLLENT